MKQISGLFMTFDKTISTKAATLSSTSGSFTQPIVFIGAITHDFEMVDEI